MGHLDAHSAAPQCRTAPVFVVYCHALQQVPTHIKVL